MTFVYIFIAPTLPFRYKIGISNNPNKRTKGVDRVAWKVLALPCVDAAQVETVCHRLCKPLHAPVKGNGGTEWFFTLNVATAALAWAYGEYYGIDMGYMPLYALVTPLPFDGTILVILTWLVQICLYLGIVVAGIFIISNYA